MKQILLAWLVLWATPYNHERAFDSNGSTIAMHDHSCSLISVEKFPSKIEADAYFATLTESQQKRAKVIELNEE